MNLQIYADKVNIDTEDKSVYLENIDLSLLVGQINTNELLEALKANDQFSAIHDFVVKELKAE